MLYSTQKKYLQLLNRRAFFLFLGKLGLISTIGWKLFDIQITNSKKYKTLSKNNQIDVKILYPTRGIITDRSGFQLANNVKVFDLYIIPERTENIELSLRELSNFLKLDFSKKKEIIKLSKKVKKFERIKIFENLSWEKLEILETNKNYLSGFELVQDYQRIYPTKELFAHIIGYINKPTKEDLNLPYISKMPMLNIGQQGIEKALNEVLVGKPGNKEVEVNASGRIIRKISEKASINGLAVNITYDYKLQKFLYFKLINFRAGSIVVMDIENGNILSMVSVPNFDPNLIIKKPNVKYWNSLLENPLSPLTDRSIQGLYSPGSTFKMIVAIAALHYGVINPKNKFFCGGKINFGDRPFHCWKTKGHGNMNINTAIKESCDVFFYELAIKIGIDKIAQVAKDFGLGQVYKMEIQNQKKGIIPSKKWKKENLNESWYGGETLIAAIGQGYVLTTPLQLAVMISRIASGGYKISPSVISKSKDKDFELMNKYSSAVNLVKESLFKVVNEKKGTAYKSRSPDILFSGKTGTSQVKKITLEEREREDFRNVEIEWKNRDHALFVGYMPTKKPKYAISVVIEHGGSGAATAAPIARDAFNFIKKNIL